MLLTILSEQLWTIDQESGIGTSSDPVLRGSPAKGTSANRNALEPSPSRPAIEALRDYMNRIASLEWPLGEVWLNSLAVS
jgi:hypothetical protein